MIETWICVGVLFLLCLIWLFIKRAEIKSFFKKEKKKEKVNKQKKKEEVLEPKAKEQIKQTPQEKVLANLLKDQKIYILDSSVFAYDGRAISKFKDNMVIITGDTYGIVERLQEDDKRRSAGVSHNCILAIEFINNILYEDMANNSFKDYSSDGNTICYVKDKKNNIDFIFDSRNLSSYDLSSSDEDRIVINTAKKYKKAYGKGSWKKVVIVSQKREMHSKSKFFGGVKVEEYIHGKASIAYTGRKDITLQKDDYDFLLENMEENKARLTKNLRMIVKKSKLLNIPIFEKLINSKLKDDSQRIYSNECLYIKQEDSPNYMLATYKNTTGVKPHLSIFRQFPGENNSNKNGFSPKNIEQEFAHELGLDQDVRVLFLIGSAGTGKTLQSVEIIDIDPRDHRKPENRRMTARVIRSTEEAGKEMGFLKGDENDKFAVYAQVVYDAIEKYGILKGHSRTKIDELKKSISVHPSNYIQGMTFEVPVVVIDDAQNFDFDTLVTIATRCSNNTKLVITGDFGNTQVKRRYMGSTGLPRFINMMKEYPDGATVTLSIALRSGIAEYINKRIE